MKLTNLLITALLAITVTGAAALADSAGITAGFTTDANPGAAPLTVQFTDTSAGSPIAWQWDFGDGSPVATDQNPSHTFPEPGTYTVTQTVTDGTNTDVATSDITVNSGNEVAPVPLAAAITADTADGTAPLTVQFSDASTGTPSGWLWNFGDGSPVVTDQNTSHTFQSSGSYTVTLNVTDGSRTSTATKQITVEEAATVTPTVETPTVTPVDVTAAPTTEPPTPTPAPTPALSAGATALALIATAGLVLVIGKAGKK